MYYTKHNKKYNMTCKVCKQHNTPTVCGGFASPSAAQVELTASALPIFCTCSVLIRFGLFCLSAAYLRPISFGSGATNWLECINAKPIQLASHPTIHPSSQDQIKPVFEVPKHIWSENDPVWKKTKF